MRLQGPSRINHQRSPESCSCSGRSPPSFCLLITKEIHKYLFFESERVGALGRVEHSLVRRGRKFRSWPESGARSGGRGAGRACGPRDGSQLGPAPPPPPRPARPAHAGKKRRQSERTCRVLFASSPGARPCSRLLTCISLFTPPQHSR